MEISRLRFTSFEMTDGVVSFGMTDGIVSFAMTGGVVASQDIPQNQLETVLGPTTSNMKNDRVTSTSLLLPFASVPPVPSARPLVPGAADHLL